MKSTKYSAEWIRNLTDNEWEIEREIVRQNSCNPRLAYEEKVRWLSIRDLFDKIKREKEWGNLSPHGPVSRSEHGWYLQEDDD